MAHPTSDRAQAEARVQGFRRSYRLVVEEIERVIVGQRPVVEGVVTCLLAEGHVLLEGVPGLGKTRLVQTLAQALALTFSRIQFTPDLMPADVVGTNVIVEKDGHRGFSFFEGPVFAHLVLADEINRATPKTQSALLEAMQEARVTVAGETRALPRPFMVLATQNPIEMEGTYPLPEAQLDRFLMKLIVPFPGREDLHLIMDRTLGLDSPQAQAVLGEKELAQMTATAREVVLARHVQDMALRILEATHPGSPEAPAEVKRFIRYGASPRGGQALLLSSRIRALAQGRLNVSADDIRAMAPAVLRHRLILNFEAGAKGIGADQIIQAVLKAVG